MITLDIERDGCELTVQIEVEHYAPATKDQPATPWTAGSPGEPETIAINERAETETGETITLTESEIEQAERLALKEIKKPKEY